MTSTIRMLKKKIDHKDGIYVYGLSDLHVGSKEFNEPLFQKMSRSILEKENGYLVVAGDIIDNGTKNSVTGPYEQTMSPKAQRDYAAELLYPLRDRIICGVAGNHERRSTKDSDTDPAELIFSKIGIEDVYRDSLCFVSLQVGDRSSHTVRAPRYCICVMHGSSGGQLMGAGLNKADQFASVSGADLTILGHSHKPANAPASRLECDHAKGIMVQRNYMVMICTAWLDYGGYPTTMGLKALPIAPNRVWLSANKFDMEVHQRISG